MDPFVAVAEVEVVSEERDVGSKAEMCFLFGVARTFWNSAKENGWPAGFVADKHGVLVSEWSSFELRPKALLQSGIDCAVHAGRHLPKKDDVSVMVLLRKDGLVMAVTGATDGRVLETVLFEGDRPPLSLRDTFSEEDPDCLVCCARPRNVVLLPCRHCCCCTECLARMDKCPVCRAAVESFVSFGEQEEDHIVAAAQEEELDVL